MNNKPGMARSVVTKFDTPTTAATTSTSTSTINTDTHHESSPLRKEASSERHTLPTYYYLSSRRNKTYRNSSFCPSSLWIRNGSGIVCLLLLLSTVVVGLSCRRYSITSASSSPEARLRGTTQAMAMISETTNTNLEQQQQRVREKDFPMNVSLWLMPPREMANQAQKVIDDISAQTGGPRFSPHVTLGSTTLTSLTAARDLAEQLKKNLSGWGPVECRIGETVPSGNTWSQALVLELAPPLEPFLNVCRASRNLLGVGTTSNNDCLAFPPPLRIPHMSLYYGDAPPPPPNERFATSIFGTSPKSFRADRVVLWKTDPPTVEGVPQWEPLAEIPLL